MKDLKIAQPKTADELIALLAETQERVAMMAGGTDLLDELKSGVEKAELVVDLQTVAGLAGIAQDRDGLRIGAMTRIVDLAEDAAVARDYPSLKEAALSLATPQLRNVGTVGGNLCQRPRCWYYRDPQVVCRKKGGFNCYAYQGRNKYHAIVGGSSCHIVFPSDLAPVLISLAAKLTLASAKGEKFVPVEAFYTLPDFDVTRENVLVQGQYLKDVRIPAPKAGQKAVYVKLKERGTWDFALVSAAVAVIVSGGVVTDINVIMGGIAPVPWRLKKIEDMMRGKAVSEALVRQAADAALKDVTPLRENGYKTDLVRAALNQAFMAVGA
jgi:xanthine dehydrogenase YagS FAD-binding subunit